MYYLESRLKRTATDSHVRINFLHNWLGERARHGFDLLGYAIVLPLLVCQRGLKMVRHRGVLQVGA